MKKMIAVLVLCIVSATASAQSALPPADTPRGERAMQQLQARFASANTTGDGKLTRDPGDSCRHADGRETTSTKSTRSTISVMSRLAQIEDLDEAKSNGTLNANEGGRRVMEQVNRRLSCWTTKPNCATCCNLPVSDGPRVLRAHHRPLSASSSTATFSANRTTCSWLDLMMDAGRWALTVSAGGWRG